MQVQRYEVEMTEFVPNTRSLPQKTLFSLFKFFNKQQLLNAALVCRDWHRIARDPLLWHSFRKEVFQHCMHKGIDLKKSFTIPECTHQSISRDGKTIVLKKKNSDELICLDHSSRRVSTRKTTREGEKYSVLTEGVFTFNKKKILFTRNDGTVFELPISFDRNNEYQDHHVAYLNAKIYILEPECLCAYDLSTKQMKVLTRLEGFDHAMSSIRFFDDQLFITKRNRNGPSLLEMWDTKKMRLLHREECSSWGVLRKDEWDHLYIAGNRGMTTINLKTLEIIKISFTQYHYCPNLFSYDHFSKRILEVIKDTLHIYDPIENVHQELPIETSRNILSVFRISLIGHYVIFFKLSLANSDSETSVWEIKNNRVVFLKNFTEVSNGGYINGVFYKVQENILTILDNTYPPFKSLDPKKTKMCLVS